MTASWTKTLRSFSVAGIAAALAFTPALMGSANATPVRPWMNTALSPEQRAAKLISAMNLSQKIHMLSGTKLTGPHTPAIGYIPPIPELGIPEFVQSDGPAGVRNGADPATKFPAPLAYAASWDPAMAQLQGRVAGEEARALGTDQLYGPGFNIARNPLGGRGFEYYGEDPYLSGTMATANVKGIQSAGVIATLKHFVANNQETARNIGNSRVPERALHEIYMKPFEMAVKQANPGSVMCAYNALNGTHSCSNYYTLTKYLRHTWGFGGYVVTDFPASWSTEDFKNGLNVEMPQTFTSLEPTVRLAIKQGRLSEKDIDARVKETLTVMFRFGMFDRTKQIHPVNVARGNSAAQKIAEQGAVLLKNKNSVLPLKTNTARRIAIFGAPAKVAVGGGGSSNVSATETDTALDEITKRSRGAKVSYSSGLNHLSAAQEAKKADVAIVFVTNLTMEAMDRTSINLLSEQTALINKVASANKNTIVVLNTGGPIAMPWLPKVAAVLNMWQPGQAGGKATASLLYGDVNPSGHLPQTFPTADGQWPAHTLAQFPGGPLGLTPTYSEGIFVGYRWYQSRNQVPLFPFGYGLSYTTFAYSVPRMQATSGAANTPIKVTFTVTNTGKRAGATVPQVYVGKPRNQGVSVPPKELGGFQKVYLRPGESKTITITVLPQQLSYWNSNLHKFVVMPGVYHIYLGSNVNETSYTLNYTVR